MLWPIVMTSLVLIFGLAGHRHRGGIGAMVCAMLAVGFVPLFYVVIPRWAGRAG